MRCLVLNSQLHQYLMIPFAARLFPTVRYDAVGALPCIGCFHRVHGTLRNIVSVEVSEKWTKAWLLAMVPLSMVSMLRPKDQGLSHWRTPRHTRIVCRAIPGLASYMRTSLSA